MPHNDDDDSVLDPPAVGDDDGDDGSGSGEAAAEAASTGAMPQNGASGAGATRRGGRRAGSRNKATIAREQAAAAGASVTEIHAAGVGASPTTSRPTGKTGAFPGEEGKIPVDADLLWMYVLEEIQKEGYSPYDMEIRVDRMTPPPAGPVCTIEASAVQGDANVSPATALRNYMTDWVYLPSGIMGPATYTLHFCWRNSAKFFRRGELRMQSRNEILAMKQSDAARHAQAGAAGMGSLPQQQPQAHPHAPQPQQQQFAPQPWQQYAPQQPQQPVFDADAERARIRHELERDFEMRELRRELDDLRRRPQQPPPQYAPQYAPPQQRRGVGVGGAPQQYAPQHAPQQYAPPPESEDERTARIVVQVLQASGVIPQRGAPPAAGVGSPITTAVQQASGLGEDFERAMDTVQRGKKVFKKMKELFDEDDDAPPAAKKKTGVGAAPDDEDAAPQPRLRFHDTGQFYKGHKIMAPIDAAGEPIIPSTFAEGLAVGFANPFLLEPVAQGLGAIMQRAASLTAGLGAQPQQQPQRTDIHVQQQAQPQQQQPTQQFAPPPTPYTPPLPAQPTPTEGGDWNLT